MRELNNQLSQDYTCTRIWIKSFKKTLIENWCLSRIFSDSDFSHETSPMQQQVLSIRLIFQPASQFENMRVESEKMLKQRDCVFLKVDALEWWKIKKSKKSMEIQKSYRALKMPENWLSVNWILVQLQVFAQKSL